MALALGDADDVVVHLHDLAGNPLGTVPVAMGPSSADWPDISWADGFLVARDDHVAGARVCPPR